MFCQTLKKLRERDDLSQIQFAKEIGFSQASISAWENNTREPGIEALKNIARYFNVSVDYLVNEQQKQKLEKQNDFTATEEKLLKNFRKLPPDLQRRAFAYMEKLVNVIDEESVSIFPKPYTPPSSISRKA